MNEKNNEEIIRASRKKGLSGWLVEPYKQVKIGLIFLLVNFLFAALFLGVFGYIILDMQETLITYFKLDPEQVKQVTSKFSWVIIVGVALMIMFIITTILVSVQYTHKIYGPLVSINRYLDKVAEGTDYGKPLKLRDGDQLQMLALKINNAIEKIRK